MAWIVDYLPVEELEARYRAARDATEARHYHGVRHGSMRQPTAVEVTATGGQSHGSDPQQRDPMGR
jgi:hypothetical protein